MYPDRKRLYLDENGYLCDEDGPLENSIPIDYLEAQKKRGRKPWEYRPKALPAWLERLFAKLR